MGTINNFSDLFEHQLKDIYNAETQLLEALPEFQEKATNKELKNALSQHLEETKEQIIRLENIASSLNINPKGETCEAMKGLIKEAKSFVEETAEGDVRDAGIIADAQRIEHYEISAYGTITHYARALNKEEISKVLKESLSEESNADQILNDLAVNNINRQAKEEVYA